MGVDSKHSHPQLVTETSATKCRRGPKWAAEKAPFLNSFELIGLGVDTNARSAQCSMLKRTFRPHPPQRYRAVEAATSAESQVGAPTTCNHGANGRTSAILANGQIRQDRFRQLTRAVTNRRRAIVLCKEGSRSGTRVNFAMVKRDRRAARWRKRLLALRQVMPPP